MRPFMVLGGLSLISFVLVAIPAFIMLSLLLKAGQQLSFGEMLYVITAVLILFEANVGAAFIPKIRKGKFIVLSNVVFSALVFVIVVAMMGSVNYIPARMMEIYKLGNLEADKVVFDERACKIYAAYDISTRPISEFERICSVNNLKILSALGDEWYFEMKDSERRFIVPSEHVLSWVIDKS